MLQKHYDFDVNVSFPAGLLIKKMKSSVSGDLGGGYMMPAKTFFWIIVPGIDIQI